MKIFAFSKEPTGNNYICWLLYYTAQGGSAIECIGYTYDAYNRNISVCGAGYVQQNHYDAEGLRYAVTENGETTNFVYRNGMPVSELDADKNPVRGYVLGNEYISQSDGTSFGYYLNDEQGSVRYLTGSDGGIRNHYRYSAFGETITAEETVSNRLRYNGQMADGLTGLYYLRARYYNASLGRFTQEDVIYNDGLNLYAYCNSNPVMYSDPSGFAATQSLNDCNPKNGGEKDSKSGRSATFYKNNPMDNPKAARDIIENPNAVYGFSPNPESTRIGKYANKIDWTNPEQVAIARQTRKAYHDANESMLQSLYDKGYTTQDIAKKMVEERNSNRINSYIKNGDLEGLAIVKQSNLETYGNEFGMSLEQALDKYGSYQEVINATVGSNPGMDACTGLYDIYHGGK